MKYLILGVILAAILGVALIPNNAQSWVAEASTLPDLTTPAQIAEYIEQQALNAQISPSRALRIAKCESSLRFDAKNPKSSSKGIYQWIDSSWKYYGVMHWGSLEGRDVFDARDNIDLAIWVMKTYGFFPWECR